MAEDRRKTVKMRATLTEEEQKEGPSIALRLQKTLPLGCLGVTELKPETEAEQRLNKKAKNGEKGGSNRAYGLPDELFLKKHEKEKDKGTFKKTMRLIKERYESGTAQLAMMKKVNDMEKSKAGPLGQFSD